MEAENYYLSSLDSARFSPTRECTVLRHLQFSTGKKCILVRLFPPVISQDYGVGVDLSEFILTNRYEGESLSPIKTFPCAVFIARYLLADIGGRDEISKDEIEVIAWGELYKSKNDADNHVFD
jgi:hypothetical protein